MEQMEKSGCRVGDNFVKAVVCTGPVAGGFTRGKGVKRNCFHVSSFSDTICSCTLGFVYVDAQFLFVSHVSRSLSAVTISPFKMK